MADDKGILAQLLEEVAAASADKARQEDFAVNLKNKDGDEVTGIPISQAAGWLYERFGIGEKPAKKAGGDGGTGSGAAAGAQGTGQAEGGANPVADFFRGGKRAAGS